MLTVFEEDVSHGDAAVAKLNSVATQLRADIATAIAEQREQSAKIAESFIREHGQAAKVIAAAIRKNRLNY